MESNRFDILARSLTENPSRRGLLRGLGSAALGLAALRVSGVVSAKKRRKKKRKKRKKSRPCEPDCNGKDCSGDGCGGSCGPCTGGTCQDGLCACPEDKCGGTCVAECHGPQVRNPMTCACCVENGITLPLGECDRCCSDVCVLAGSLDDPLVRCSGQSADMECEFDAQCASNDCQESGPGAGTCA